MHLESKNLIFAKNLLTLIVLVLAGWYVTDHLKYSLTESLSKRVFWSVEAGESRPITTGQYVIFNQFVPKPYSRVVKFIKRAGCTSGEQLKVENDFYYCNGLYLGHAKKNSLAGTVKIPFVFNGVVPPNMVFAIGDHPDSYDSRYVGFISRERIERVAWAIF